MKIGIIGTGAVGGYYGALLVRHGLDVHFLIGSDFAHVRREGLRVESKGGDMILPEILAYARPEDMPPCDLVIVALKTTANDHLQTILPHAARPDATVVVLQNGLGVEEDIIRLLPKATVMGGLCFLCSNKVGPGHIRHLDYGSIRLGQHRPDGKPTGLTDALQRIGRLFECAGVEVHLTGDLGKARWEKLVWNMPFNGLSVILNADTRELMNSGSAEILLRDIMVEVIGAARSCGHAIGDRFVEKMFAATNAMVAYKPSMKLDYEAGRPMEIEMIYRRPIAAATAAGYQMIRSRLIALQLDYLDARNRVR